MDFRVYVLLQMTLQEAQNSESHHSRAKYPN